MGPGGEPVSNILGRAAGGRAADGGVGSGGIGRGGRTATPVAAGTATSEGWNDAISWHSDGRLIPSTPPRSSARCRCRFGGLSGVPAREGRRPRTGRWRDIVAGFPSAPASHHRAQSDTRRGSRTFRESGMRMEPSSNHFGGWLPSAPNAASRVTRPSSMDTRWTRSESPLGSQLMAANALPSGEGSIDTTAPSAGGKRKVESRKSGDAEAPKAHRIRDDDLSPAGHRLHDHIIIPRDGAGRRGPPR